MAKGTRGGDAAHPRTRRTNAAQAQMSLRKRKHATRGTTPSSSSSAPGKASGNLSSSDISAAWDMIEQYVRANRAVQHRIDQLRAKDRPTALPVALVWSILCGVAVAMATPAVWLSFHGNFDSFPSSFFSGLLIPVTGFLLALLPVWAGLRAYSPGLASPLLTLLLFGDPYRAVSSKPSTPSSSSSSSTSSSSANATTSSSASSSSPVVRQRRSSSSPTPTLPTSLPRQHTEEADSTSVDASSTSASSSTSSSDSQRTRPRSHSLLVSPPLSVHARPTFEEYFAPARLASVLRWAALLLLLSLCTHHLLHCGGLHRWMPEQAASLAAALWPADSLRSAHTHDAHSEATTAASVLEQAGQTHSVQHQQLADHRDKLSRAVPGWALALSSVGLPFVEEALFRLSLLPACLLLLRSPFLLLKRVFGGRRAGSAAISSSRSRALSPLSSLLTLLLAVLLLASLESLVHSLLLPFLLDAHRLAADPRDLTAWSVVCGQCPHSLAGWFTQPLALLTVLRTSFTALLLPHLLSAHALASLCFSTVFLLFGVETSLLFHVGSHTLLQWLLWVTDSCSACQVDETVRGLLSVAA